ncbi:unnamed protein product, partial [Allacma fusca]
AIFKSAIEDDKSLTDSERLQYLIRCLNGPPRDTVKNFPITNASFVPALKLLKDNYSNPRLLVHDNIEKFLGLPHLTVESAPALQKMIDQTYQGISVLRNEGQPADQWGTLVTHILIQKLDPKSRELYESQQAATEVPVYDDLIKFLKKRVGSLRVLSSTTPTSTKQTTNTKSKSVASNVSTTRTCLVCGENDHVALHQCSKFVSMSVADRKALVQEKQLCFNCLRSGHGASSFHHQLTALVLPTVTGLLPSATCTPTMWNHLTYLLLADPQWFKSGKIDLLIGSDLYYSILRTGHMPSVSGSPVALLTSFGWILGGPVEEEKATEVVTSHVVQVGVEDILYDFGKLEEVPTTTATSKKAERCEEHLLKTVKGEPDGQFNVRLPFESNTMLSTTYELAPRRLKSMETRFASQPKMKLQYQRFMDDDESLGHMEQVQHQHCDGQTKTTFNVPHHAVVRPDSLVVLDISARGKCGSSLNAILLVGPKIQQDFIPTLIRFRHHLIGLKSDMEMIYRQVLVSPDDQDLQRILGREPPGQPVKIFRLNTVTYGTASVPYQAFHCLKKLAPEDWGEVSETLDIGQDVILKTLGLPWNLSQDHSSFKVTVLTDNKKLMKRSLLSQMARLDPLGWLAPVRIKLKLMFQDLWESGQGWDDVVPPDINALWDQIKSKLPIIEEIQIPHGLTQSGVTQCEVQGFSDADEVACGAVIYLRAISSYGNVQVRLRCSQPKIVPVQKASLSRLELYGLLLTTLMEVLMRTLLHMDPGIYCWTNSAIVLHWLPGDSHRWQTLVENRMSRVQSSFPIAHWHYVRGKDNPADCISRGILPAELLNHPLRWTGPSWLSQAPKEYPTHKEVPAHPGLFTQSIGTKPAQQGNLWTFIPYDPPHSPHFEGIWNTVLKSAKYPLHRFTEGTTLTRRHYHVLLARIEGVLNSRPWCPPSSGSSDVQALTPGYLFIRRLIISVPEPALQHLPDSRLPHWQRVSICHNIFGPAGEDQAHPNSWISLETIS